MKQQRSLLSATMQSHHQQVPRSGEHMPPCHEHPVTIPSTKGMPKHEDRQEVVLQMTQHYRNNQAKIKHTNTQRMN